MNSLETMLAALDVAEFSVDQLLPLADAYEEAGDLESAGLARRVHASGLVPRPITLEGGVPGFLWIMPGADWAVDRYDWSAQTYLIGFKDWHNGTLYECLLFSKKAMRRVEPLNGVCFASRRDAYLAMLDAVYRVDQFTSYSVSREALNKGAYHPARALLLASAWEETGPLQAEALRLAVRGGMRPRRISSGCPGTGWLWAWSRPQLNWFSKPPHEVWLYRCQVQFSMDVFRQMRSGCILATDRDYVFFRSRADAFCTLAEAFAAVAARPAWSGGYLVTGEVDA